MERAGFLALALNGLEVVEAALASDLALKLFEAVEGHTGGIRSKLGRRKK